MTIIDFILARYADLEQAAQAAAAGGPWRYEGSDSVGAWTLYDEHWSIASLTVYDTKTYNYSERMPAVRNPVYVDPDANGRHIALNDPAYVLVDLAAKRVVVETLRSYEPPDEWDSQPDMGRRSNNAAGALRRMALPFAGHPDYDEAWQPV